MSKYDEMSDFELEVKVHILNDGLENKEPAPKYCSDPSVTWPIMVENMIDICFSDRSSAFGGSVSLDGVYEYSHFNKNPLRAAMIVFLMMKDAE